MDCYLIEVLIYCSNHSLRVMDSISTTNAIANIDLFFNEDGLAVKNLGKMAAKIALYNFEWRYFALVVFLTSPSPRAVDTFLSIYNKSVVIKFGKFRPRRRGVHIHQYVLFGEDTSEILDYLKWLIEMKYDNTGKMLLLCCSKEDKKCNENKVFEELANIYVNNAIFLRIDAENEPVPFTYQVLPGLCGNIKPVRMNITNGCLHDSCFELAYRERLSNWQMCPIIVSTFEQPPFMYLYNGTKEPTGGDADMLKIVTSALNATLIIKTPSDGNDWGHYTDNNWTGSMGDVFNDRAHLSVCSLPLTTHQYGNFQISFIYNTMDIVWVAKLPALKPSWEKLLRPFNYNARVALFTSFILVTALAIFSRTYTWKMLSKSLNIGSTKESILFYAGVIFLGIPLLKVPSKRALLVTVYSWIWFCFIIRSCYQAALIHNLKKDVYEQSFEDFSDVTHKKLRYGGQGSYREYFADEKDIYDNWQQLESKEAHEMLHRISNGTSNFVLAYNKEMVIEHLLNHHGTHRVQMIPRKIVNSPAVMYLRRYSPIAAPLNTALSRAVEAGYTQAWHMRFARQKKVLFEHEKSRGSKALNLDNFGGCFIVTIFGWVVSILFFIIELYCGKMEKYHK